MTPWGNLCQAYKNPKVKYPNKRFAMRVLASEMRKGKKGLKAYECRSCGQYHLGREKKPVVEVDKETNVPYNSEQEDRLEVILSWMKED